MSTVRVPFHQQPQSPTGDERQLRAEFVALLPTLKTILRYKFRRLDAEARGEAVSEGISLAFSGWLAARRRHRKVSVRSLAYYAALSVRSGRGLAGTYAADLLSPARRSKRQWKPSGRRLSEMSPAVLDELLADRRGRWPILDKVAFRIDWIEFLKEQPLRTRRIIGLLARGFRRVEVARMLRVSPPAVTQRMNRARSAWRRLWNEESEPACAV